MMASQVDIARVLLALEVIQCAVAVGRITATDDARALVSAIAERPTLPDGMALAAVVERACEARLADTTRSDTTEQLGLLALLFAAEAVEALSAGTEGACEAIRSFSDCALKFLTMRASPSELRARLRVLQVQPAVV